MSDAQSIVEHIVGHLKRDPSYRIAGVYTDRQLATVLWHRAWQLMRGLALTARCRRVRWPVFRGKRAVIEHAYALTSGPGLILEDGAAILALSRDGIHLGRNVTIGRGTTLSCTGVLARPGVGITIGSRSAIGAGGFVGGQGGVRIGDDVIIGPGVRIFSENHNFEDSALPIRAQGEQRVGVSIADDCWIGASVTIVDGVSIGAGCVVAAGAVVTRDLVAYSVAAGVPARTIKSRRPADAVSTARAHQADQ